MQGRLWQGISFQQATTMRFSITAIFLVSLFVANNLQALLADDFTTVRKLIRNRMQEHQIPSVVVGVSRGTEVLWTEAFGYSNLENKTKATTHTLYRIGSTTKPLTATALMTLVERGDLDLDRHINDYLNNAKVEIRIGNIDKATLRSVVHHRSGLPSHWQTFFPDETERPPSINLLIDRYGKLMIKPGLWFNYSNLGYEMLADIISRKSGKQFHQFVQEEVFLPLGMQHTFLPLQEPKKHQVAVGYQSSGNSVPHILTATPAAGDAYSTVHDLLRFGMFHMKLPLDAQQQILTEATIDQMQNSIHPMGNEQYGLGWHVRTDADGRKHVLHGGAHVGWECHFGMIPEEKLCVVVFANKDTIWPGYRVCLETADHIFAALLGCELKDVQPPSGHQLGLIPQAPESVPGKLLGTWSGTVETHLRKIPITLVFQKDGDVHAKLDQQLTALLNDARFIDDVFQGSMLADIGTPDANRRKYILDWDLTFREGQLSGILYAKGKDKGGYVSGRGLLLGHWVSLSREPE